MSSFCGWHQSIFVSINFCLSAGFRMISKEEPVQYSDWHPNCVVPLLHGIDTPDLIQIYRNTSVYIQSKTCMKNLREQV